MKLYFSPGSCALASQIVLREAGQTVELVKVDFKTKRTAEGEFVEVTKKGQIPALQLDDGAVLTESAVILQWIADQHPSLGLLPAYGTRERYRALEWLNFVATDMHKGLSILFSPLIDDASKAQYTDKLIRGKFQYIDAHLASNDYVMGEQFTVADAYLYNVLRWPERLGLDMSQYPNIPVFMRRMEARPAVLAALKAEGLRLPRSA